MELIEATCCSQGCDTTEEEEDGPAPEALSVDDLPNAAEIKAMPFERQWRKVRPVASGPLAALACLCNTCNVGSLPRIFNRYGSTSSGAWHIASLC